ncbi:DUF1109 domain-containing protein [Loktanella sp. TSTF-M6]|uniref:DUF1109 domain-containing protein n=1 Tax=Loktanella gaetbuli TaxID=2881335 RepID=A0ABS8BS22_9RHOB|nr:DUF1109 domain-containing protein [Loktanella gaetbuli]MCB5198427.1 DUF1109 domain-containing protein [Loktanella gaetbuli]
MNTDDLIKSLGSELTPLPRGYLTRQIATGLLAGLAGTSALFFAFWGVRSDLIGIVSDLALFAKTVLPLMLASLALFWLHATARPAGRSCAARLIWGIPLALILLVAMTLVTTPGDAWPMALRGKSIVTCLISIPVLSVPILIGLLAALRRGAPEHPALCGAVAGLGAGATAATVYSVYCIENSPLFYASWYSLAVLAVAGCGGILGYFFLRW